MVQFRYLPGILLILTPFILLLLANLSATHIPTIKYLSIVNSESSAHIDLGIYGACYYPSGNSTQKSCSHNLGYTLDAIRYLDSTPTSPEALEFPYIVPHKLGTSLVLNTIALGFTGLALFCTIGLFLVDEDSLAVLCLGPPIIFARLLVWISFWLDLAFVLVVRNRIHERLGDDAWAGHIGNGFWLTFASAVAMTIIYC